MLADQWTTTAPSTATAFSPYEGAPDLNAAAALQLDGVLFMEGGGEPGEIHHLKRDLRTCADDAAGAGEWLATAMQSSWDLAFVLLEIDELADLLGERHRIIANNWQGASIMSLAALILHRAADLLDRVDFTPAAVRADLADGLDDGHSRVKVLDQLTDRDVHDRLVEHHHELRRRQRHQRPPPAILLLLHRRGGLTVSVPLNGRAPPRRAC